MKDRSRKSGIKRRLSFLSHALISGCAAAFLYSASRDIVIPPEVSRRQISPNLEYIIYQEEDPRTRREHVILAPTGSRKARRIDLGEGQARSISSRGTYIQIERRTDQDPLKRKIRISDRTGQEAIPETPARECAISPDETTAAILTEDRLDLRTIAGNRRIREIKDPCLTEQQSATLEFSPDGTRVLRKGSLPGGQITLFDTKSKSVISTTPASDAQSIEWIDGNDLIIRTKKGEDESLSLLSEPGRALPKLAPGETLLLATPMGKIYATEQRRRLDKTKMHLDSEIIRFYDTRGRSIQTQALPSSMVFPSRSHDGRIALQGLAANKDGTPKITDLMIFNPPRYDLELMISRARGLFFTTRGTIAHWTSNGLPGAEIRALCETDPKSGTTRTIPYNNTREKTVRDHLQWILIPMTPLALMALYGISIERKRRTIETTGYGADRLSADPMLITGAVSTAIFFGAAYQTSLLQSAKYLSGSTIATATALLGGMSLMLGAASASAMLALSRLGREMRYSRSIQKVLESGHAPSDLMQTVKEYPAAEGHIRLAGSLAIRGNHSEARIHLYDAIELCHETILPQTSYFHAVIEAAMSAVDHVEMMSRSAGKDASTRVFWQEWNQARLAIRGKTERALSWTDTILASANECLDEAQMHQARVHTALGSDRADALWQNPLTEIIHSAQNTDFEPVQGGTSEVMKVSRDKSPYAEKAVILKRSKDERSLRHEQAVTAEISAAAGRASSRPLALITQPSHSYLALLFLDGETLHAKAKNTSKTEIEKYLKEIVIPQIAWYHQALQSNISSDTACIPRMDYNQTFIDKFVKRIEEDPRRQAELIESGRHITSYLESQKRAVIHGDLHASNIITPSVTLIDPADAAIAHESLDLAHLLHDPSLKLDPTAAVILGEHYRIMRGQDPRAYRSQDIAGAAHRLCHLLGRDVAYNRPGDVPHHCQGLIWNLISLAEMGIDGIDQKTIKPIESIARSMI